VSATPGEYVNAKDGSILVFVPATAARVGSEDDQASAPPDERPAHEVVLSPFFLGKYELDTAAFARFVAETHAVTFVEENDASALDGPHVLAQRNETSEQGLNDWVYAPGSTWRALRAGEARPLEEPVVQVAWIDAVAYARWAGLRLPTEAEWEVAARWDRSARRGRVYPWGDELGDARCANVIFPLEPPPPRLLPVRSCPAGASPVGALNMAGNASEWVLDEWDERRETPDSFYARLARHEVDRHDPVYLAAWNSRAKHVHRGGHWRETSYVARGAWRGFTNGGCEVIGFRVALSLDGSRRPATLAPFSGR
jgi:formylglycine-generating enzyme required for sulfatase activity